MTFTDDNADKCISLGAVIGKLLKKLNVWKIAICLCWTSVPF